MPRGPNGEKRPADAVARAVMVARIATGEEKELSVARKGAAGATARSKALDPQRRSEIAQLAAQARWKANGSD